MKYSFFTTIDRVFKHEPIVRGFKVGDEAQLVTEDCGWFIALKSSHEAIYVGDEQPAMQVGQRVKVTIEAV